MPPERGNGPLLVTDHFSTQTQYTPLSASRLIICTRCPACHKRRPLFSLADSTLSTLQNDPLHQHHLTHQIFHQIEIIQPDVHIGITLEVVVELIRSHNEPF